MSIWNYRVLKRPDNRHVIIEVYYDDEDIIFGWIDHDMAPEGLSVDELQNDLVYMTQALEWPVLTEGDLPDELGTSGS